MEDNKSINLFKVVKLLLNNYKGIMLYCFIALLIGLVIVFSVPKVYKTEVKMAPETSENGFSGSISSLAAMVGLNLGGNTGEDAIYPEIYPELFKSVSFLSSLFDIKVVSSDGKIDTNYFDYIYNQQKHAWWGLPLYWLTHKEAALSEHLNPQHLSKEEYLSALKIGKCIKCVVDKKTSVISLNVKAQDPQISAQLADSVRSRLQNFITDYRTQKARRDLKYFEELRDDAKAKYSEARRAYAEYYDSNSNVVLSRYKVKLDELKNEVDMASDLYSQLSQQVQLAQAKVLEKTPAFTTIQAATVPVKGANIPKSISLLFFIFLGFVVKAGILVYRNISELR